MVVTATSARQPVIKREWISAGAHINGIGTYSPQAREIDSATMASSRIFVDRRESALNEAGDYLLAAEEGLIGPENIVAEIGEVLLGQKQGRTQCPGVLEADVARSQLRRRPILEQTRSLVMRTVLAIPAHQMDIVRELVV